MNTFESCWSYRRLEINKNWQEIEKAIGEYRTTITYSRHGMDMAWTRSWITHVLWTYHASLHWNCLLARSAPHAQATNLDNPDLATVDRGEGTCHLFLLLTSAEAMWIVLSLYSLSWANQANWCYSNQDLCVIKPAPYPPTTAPLSSAALWVIQLFSFQTTSHKGIKTQKSDPNHKR